MHARSTTIKGDPQNVDRGITYLRDEVMPLIRDIDGFVGMSTLCDRDTGRCIVTTAWESEEAMRASAELVRDNRMRSAEVFGDRSPQVEEWEIALMHRTRESPEGACSRVTWVRTDPNDMDRSITAYRERVVPAIEPWYGFCSVSGLVDRGRGVAAVAVTYESREAIERSRPEAMALRDRIAEETGAEVLDVAEFELALAHLRVPETV